MTIHIGDTLGQYRVEALLGEGGFATVYKGYQASFDRLVAIKVLNERLSHNQGFVERFRREAEATFSLKHPNIVEVYDFQEMDGTTFMVMKYVDGRSLRDVLVGKGAFDARTGKEDATRLREEVDATQLREVPSDDTVMKQLTGNYEPLPVGIVAQIAKDVCAALTYAHKQGVIHRDLKPDNVLLARDGRALLTDFGIARVQEESQLTRTGATMGTWAYMSPEQFSNPKEVNSRTDIYSLGIMLYESLTGSVPFVGVDSEVLQKHLSEKPLPPRTLRGDIPVVLEEVVLKCLEKSPEKRFPTAEKVARAILAKIKPMPLTALFGSDTGKAGLKKDWKEEQELICPLCGLGFSAMGVSVKCPGCGAETKRQAAQQGLKDRVQAGRKFMGVYNFDHGLSMDVRAFLYRKTVKPDLLRTYEDLVKQWASGLQGGSVVTPVMGEGDWPNGDETVAIVKKILEFTDLWDSEALNDYVVEIEERRERKKRMARLEGRAYQLLGLYQCLEAVQGQSNEEMVAAYQAAHGWYERSEQTLHDFEPELAASAGFSKQFVDVILYFPAEPGNAIPEVNIQPDQAPGVKEDLFQYRQYQGVLGRIEENIRRLKGEAQAVLDKVKFQIDQLVQQLAGFKQEVEDQLERHQKKIVQINGKFAKEISQLQSIIKINRWMILFTPWVLGLSGMIILVPRIVNRSSFLNLFASPPFGMMILSLSLGYLYVRIPSNPQKLTWWDASPIAAAALGLFLTNRIFGILAAVLGAVGLVLAGTRWKQNRSSSPLAFLIIVLMAAAPAIFLQFYSYQYAITRLRDPKFLFPEVLVGLLLSIVIGVVYRNRKPKLDSAQARLEATLLDEDAAHQKKLSEIDSKRVNTLNTFKSSSDADIRTAVNRLEEAEHQAYELSLRMLRTKTFLELAKTGELRAYADELNSNRSQYIQVEEIPRKLPGIDHARAKS